VVIKHKSEKKALNSIQYVADTQYIFVEKFHLILLEYLIQLRTLNYVFSVRDPWGKSVGELGHCEYN
jgi:hypothetical protein